MRRILITKLYLFIQLTYSNNLWNWIADDFDVLMRTHGEISFAPYVHGDFQAHTPEPGYRSDFNAYVDFFEWKGLISNWLISNTTIIERNKKSSLKLDKIRYTLTPGYRIEFQKHLISGLLLHECIHTISKPEDNGAIWWNSFQFGFGTKSAYQKYLVNKYVGRDARYKPSLDYNFNLGVFLYGDQSVWIKQNHDYRYEVFYKLRLHMLKIKDWGFYIDVNHHVWIDKYNEFENKLDFTINVLLTGKMNIASLYYQYFIYDNFSKDNQSELGAIGFKIVF